MKAPIAWMAKNHVASNLLMFFFLIGGLLTGSTIKQEVFPSIALDVVTVVVPYPGAGPEEIEEGIILKLEETLHGVKGIKKITSKAVENAGTVTLELLTGEDVDDVLQDIRLEVDRLTTLPVEAEKPVVTKIVTRSEVISIAIYGDISEKSLREQADIMEDDLLSLRNITQVDLTGVKSYEISIEVPEKILKSYQLTLDDIAQKIRRSSLDLPAGAIKSSSEEILLRTKQKRYSGRDYGDITILENLDGADVKLKDIATIIDGFADSDLSAHFDGKMSIMATVYRVGNQKPNEISHTVKEYIKEKNTKLPPSLKVALINDRSKIFQGRKDLLMKNASIGLVLVLIILGLFLQLRLAFWVMMGLPISFLGGLMLMPGFDVSINMISLFAFILVLGIVVDDAIVVGESIFEHRQKGKNFLDAAVDGTVEVGGPVIFSILTTMVAFSTLFFATGSMGRFIKVIPAIVIAVLIVSLIECLFILPSHLSHGKDSIKVSKNKIIKKWTSLSDRFSVKLNKFIEGPYKKFLINCLNHKAITIAVAIAILFVSFGLVGGGIIKFRFMPKIESDMVNVYLKMPVGTPAETTEKILNHIVSKGYETITEIEKEDFASPVEYLFSVMGARAGGRGPSGGLSSGDSNIGSVIMFLKEAKYREVSTGDISRKWKTLVGELPGVETLTFKSNIMEFGSNISVELTHPDFKVLSNVADSLKEKLTNYPGVINIQDNYSQGKSELNFKLKPEARLLGITETDLANQVRAAFYGAEALRIQRGRDEVRVMVRYPEEDRKSLNSLENMFIRSKDGVELPFSSAAEITEGIGYSEINREQRSRVISVNADVDPSVANAEEINADLRKNILPQLVNDYKGLKFRFGGEEEERSESTQSMLRGFTFAMFIIFAMLAIPFRSYSQPLIVMTAIPFGIVGALGGHLIMGFSLSIMSIFGMVALSGVVINDSLLLIDHINRMRHKGLELFDAVVNSGMRRFRPILLTSLTTFFGLTPMILETSIQAQFLIPMAISLAFGILFATVITLIFVPTLYLSLELFKNKFTFIDKEVHGVMEEE